MLASLPLSAHGFQNYASGVSCRRRRGRRAASAGYNTGGSGLAANPNDLALMLNLIIPFAAALMVTRARCLRRASWPAFALLLEHRAV